MWRTSEALDNDDEGSRENLVEYESLEGLNDTLSISDGISGSSTAADEATEFAEVV